MSFSYDVSQLGVSDLYRVRFMVQDTVATSALLQDEEINLALVQRGGIYGASAFLCRALATKFAREADTSDRDIRDALSQRSRAFLAMATDYEKQSSEEPGGAGIFTIGLPDGYAVQ